MEQRVHHFRRGIVGSRHEHIFASAIEQLLRAFGYPCVLVVLLARKATQEDRLAALQDPELGALLPGILHGGREAGRVAARDHDPGAFLDEPARDREADAAVAAGDQGHLAVQPSHS